MVYTISDVVSYLEMLAPPAYQESYDNAQLLTGNPKEKVKGILCSLDATEEVIDEAIEMGCNLVVAHHPIVFKGLKSLTGKNYVERTMIKAIKNDIAIYAIHTNLDHVAHGVNKKICDKIGLENTKILAPKKELLTKLTTFVPHTNLDEVLQAMFAAGAGKIGEYKDCSFITEGTGTFTPSPKANPSIGQKNVSHREPESRIEVMIPSHLERKIIAALKQAHPYEEVAYYLQKLENENQEVGAGMIGELASGVDEKEFLGLLKSKMNLKVIKHTSLLGKQIKKVAVCGGAGIFLLPMAKKLGADIFITSDIKYHEFFDAENQIVICDIGHYESEIYTKDLLLELLSQKFTNIALYLTKVVTNPITYI
ncbi:Nif3-like dinuclear metal center hexameric protein [Belliella aquatica]|uniref:GTP cyclohydrolase 1 type 2 homolog n=1 Tax=Belliella aquatica TaxID=1323734 RepID=A0ABQ1M7F0_9BACT|nr:Nif3-like dinuclear metal center hexameric protein [Belliella aquatica]MCH7405566.1 Nif3-like dinuclear metal center hexameric protein [Belliella aquatica]GGC36023.1 GTP cyclohydrolase 1 type 2 [Belliella aquatica]